MADPIPSAHLWLSLSPHGFGHAAMTAPVVDELRRRHPDLRLTIQTDVSRDFLETRYQNFDLVTGIPDFGLRMHSAIGVDEAASAQAYQSLHANFHHLVEAQARILMTAAPTVVLSNVAYVPLAAAGRAGIPSVAMGPLNWADMYAHFLSHRPEAHAILTQMRDAYAQASVFLRTIPAQIMSLGNVQDIGPVGRAGHDRRAEILARLELPADTRLGVVAFGGMDYPLMMEQWPVVPGWVWLVRHPVQDRPDMRQWEQAGIGFSDLLASAQVVVTKPGYGTFTEAAMNGTAVLYLPRENWPECPHLEDWLSNHTRSLPIGEAEMLSSGLAKKLQMLFSMPGQSVASPDGVAQAADVIDRFLPERK